MIIIALIALTSGAFAQELSLGDIYAPAEIEKLFNHSYASLKNPNCLKEYVKSEDYRSRMNDGDHIRSVNICSQGKNLKINIRYNQMGGRTGSMPSINTILYCELKLPIAAGGCAEY